MRIYYFKLVNDVYVICHEDFNVANYEQFCREMDELHEYWYESYEDAEFGLEDMNDS